MARETRTGVLLVGASPLVRSAVRHALTADDVEVVAEAANGEAALSLALTHRPDFVVVDLDLPAVGGIEVIRELARRVPRSRVIVLANSTAERDLVEAFRAGAAGYLTKDLSPEALLRSIRGARDGDLPMPRRLAAILVAHLARRSSAPSAEDREGLERLTPRETDVLRLIAGGMTDREAAEALGISIRTVETHVSNLLHKLGAGNRAEAVRLFRGPS